MVSVSALLFGGVGARSAVAIVLVNHLLDGKDGREDVDDDDEMDSALEEKGAAPFGFSADTNNNNKKLVSAVAGIPLQLAFVEQPF